ncbi:hypothetical protein BJ986_002184 [Phycicoccus badiiscoriae]|uniref:Integral membrane protein n=1 Tax=Pedococcus badiiscoriae TaxID=642776 RepID=A0A852WEP1_9MICO|nr:hypothetical protein [Pedococcus badiiscoriae]NYG07697.1 hypothetical protein [Pedococcus badiiscoriae]
MSSVRRFAAPLAIYALTRALSAVFVVLAEPGRLVRMENIPGYHSTVRARLPADYSTVMTSWDGQWYWDIVAHGYPHSAVDAAGVPVQTSLAYFPLYPLLVKGVMAVTGLGFEVVAPTLSLLLGAAAVLVVFRLVEERLDRRRALGCVALLCCFVSAPILQAAYTESLALLLVAATLLLLSRRKYLWALVSVLLLGFTRNIALALLPVVVTHWIVRTRQRTDADEPDRVPHGSLAVLTLGTLVATLEWPAVAGLIAGRPDAYLTTVKAWPGFTGSAFRPPWAAALSDAGATAWLMALVLLAVLIGLLRSGPVRRWGPELWAWTAASIGFLVLTTSASTSLPRYLLLAFPLGLVLMPGTADQATQRMQHGAVALACLVGLGTQWLWVSELLVFAGPRGGLGFP